ncbi:helix-turn-helix domain-containing protein [Gordonia malaquae]|uniref:helix-turn-helix domain-containing protein n=1 Tax=Gordonia malaquae TaxID=410332 RepID=UPI0030159FB5
MTDSADGVAGASMDPAVTRRALLLWVHSGIATVDVDGSVHEVTERKALAVPAGLTVGVGTVRGTVAVPIWLDAGVPTVRMLTVADHQSTYLLYLFALNLGFLRSDDRHPSGRHRTAPSVVAWAEPPSSPASEELTRLTRAVEQSLDRPVRLDELARTHGMSVRTIQRRFVAETGAGYSRWLLQARLLESVRLLDQGRSIGWIASRVGFADATAYSRAFRRVFGQKPSELRAMRGTEQLDPTPSESESMPILDDLDCIAVPGTRTWSRVNGSHVAIWVVSGTAAVTIGHRTWSLNCGDAIVLPAGTPNLVCADPESLVLPLGFRPPVGPSMTVDMIAAHRFSADDFPVLLHGVVSVYTTLRPRIVLDSALFDLVASRTVEPSVPQALPTETGTRQSDVTAVLAELARSPRRQMSTQELGRRLSLPPKDVNATVRAATGLDFVVWRREARMTYAREVLIRGVPPATAAREAGYAHLSAFSRAFSKTYGMSPRRFMASAEVSESRSTPPVRPPRRP